MKTRIKICCIASPEEARLAINHGASAVGLVSAMPSGPGVISETLIAEIAESAPPGIATVLLTSQQTASGIIDQQKRCRTNTIQICDELLEGTYAEMKESMPGIKLMQVVHVVDESSVDEAITISEQVDAILLDSGNPNLSVKELGGTGRVHNWSLSRLIIDSVRKPVFLAGGLNPGNVKKAIEAVRPFGVDLCSGVRTNKLLDLAKLKDFTKGVLSVS
jgi:phosphoribosylanthranilate isomerase